MVAAGPGDPDRRPFPATLASTCQLGTGHLATTFIWAWSTDPVHRAFLALQGRALGTSLSPLSAPRDDNRLITKASSALPPPSISRSWFARWVS